jgi:hypothetical protein
MFVPTDASGPAVLGKLLDTLSGRAHRRAGGGVMARLDASDLAHRLGRQAEAVCRHYLSAGHRQGNYWQVGDVRNTPGRSMFVRLTGRRPARAPAGKWTDAATGEHGDLLDVIRESCGLIDFGRRRRGPHLPQPAASRTGAGERRELAPAPSGSPEAARRLFAMSQPIGGTS